MLALIGCGSVDLYRKVGHEMRFWRRVEGTDQEVRRAVETARRLDLMAAGLGGWVAVFRLGDRPLGATRGVGLHALSLGLDPPKPIHFARRPSGIFSKDELDSGLREL